MQPPTIYHSARELPWLFGLCIATWIAAALIAGYGAWLLLQGEAWEGTQTLTYAAAAAAAGFGLYRILSWGPVLFGLVTMRIQVELMDIIRDSIPALAKNGRYELAGLILFLFFTVALIALTGVLIYEIMRYTQPSAAWRPSRRTRVGKNFSYPPNPLPPAGGRGS